MGLNPSSQRHIIGAVMGISMEVVGMRLIIAAALSVALSVSPQAAESPKTVSHGLTLVGKLKYPADFKHLDYVNPNAPKGGRVKLFTIGSFDTFNRFTIKGDAAAGLAFMYE